MKARRRTGLAATPARGAVIGLVMLSIAAGRGPLGADEVDRSPLPLTVTPVFTQVHWPNWQPHTEDGVPRSFRPILVTHAGDGSGRIFVAAQQGSIYRLPDGNAAGDAQVFLDLESRVAYDDKTNEEGLLGLAFHPKYAENGELLVYYTNRNRPHQNVVSRFKRSATDPDRADPLSEQILLTLDKPFWNHDGGTIVFGPDGYLYIATGDGGLGGDPYGNGQKLDTLLGKILRIDVDHAPEGQAYGIPADNPFRAKQGARPEIYAYGLRNVWRMAFDSKTGRLWAADVGQDTWEEIDLIESGGNYGWNLREGMHPFGKNGAQARADLLEPIWEYHHDVGKSITGGLVYRGQAIAELVGAYLYADYVSGRMWALRYDEAAGRVTENREIALPGNIPIMSFGEDEAGQAYLMTHSATGQGIYRLDPPSGGRGGAAP